MHFSNFLYFLPLNNSLELFGTLWNPMGCFGKIKIKNSIFRECLSILDILRKWLLKALKQSVKT